jgi:hypothetical protein
VVSFGKVGIPGKGQHKKRESVCLAILPKHEASFPWLHFFSRPSWLALWQVECAPSGRRSAQGNHSLGRTFPDVAVRFLLVGAHRKGWCVPETFSRFNVFFERIFLRLVSL